MNILPFTKFRMLPTTVLTVRFKGLDSLFCHSQLHLVPLHRYSIGFIIIMSPSVVNHFSKKNILFRKKAGYAIPSQIFSILACPLVASVISYFSSSAISKGTCT